MSERERRYVSGPLEFRSVDASAGTLGMIAGYGAVFDSRSGDLGGFVETISPTAFAKTLSESDVRALFNHDKSRLLGRMSAGTLRLATDTRGLHYEIDLPDTTVGRDLAVSIERGDITGSSFSFRTVSDDWEEDGDGPAVRTLLEVGPVYDVGPVTFPAYSDTTSALRSLDTWRHTTSEVLDVAPEPTSATTRHRTRRAIDHDRLAYSLTDTRKV